MAWFDFNKWFSASSNSILANSALLKRTSVFNGTADNIEVDALSMCDEISDRMPDADVEKLSDNPSSVSLGSS